MKLLPYTSVDAPEKSSHEDVFQLHLSVLFRSFIVIFRFCEILSFPGESARAWMSLFSLTLWNIQRIILILSSLVSPPLCSVILQPTTAVRLCRSPCVRSADMSPGISRTRSPARVAWRRWQNTDSALSRIWLSTWPSSWWARRRWRRGFMSLSATVTWWRRKNLNGHRCYSDLDAEWWLLTC